MDLAKVCISKMVYCSTRFTLEQQSVGGGGQTNPPPDRFSYFKTEALK